MKLHFYILKGLYGSNPKARYDAGISNLSADGTVVVEQRKHWKKNRHGNLFAC